MKRFLSKCLLLGLILLLVLAAAGQVYKGTTAYRNTEITEDTVKYHYVPEEVDFAVFGPSHGRDAFPFYEAYEHAFNFALSSQTPAYDYLVMRQFQDRIQPGATVVITVSYLSPYWYESQEEFQDKQERYYRFLSPWNIQDVDIPHWLLQRISPLLTTSVESTVAAFLHPPALADDPNAAAGTHQIQQSDIASEQERIAQDHVAVVERGYPTVNPVMWEAFENMLTLCEEKGWNAILLTPPYLADYTACFPEGFYEEFCRQVESLSDQYDVAWLNYSRDEDFAHAYAYFKNIDHLNYAGAEVFEEKFRNDLAAVPAS